MCESLGKSMLIQLKSFQKINAQNQPIKESKVINKTCSTLPQINLNDVQDNRYLINFKGGNTLVIDKMQKMVKSKSYDFKELKKLYESLSETAKQNFNGILEKLKNEGLTFEQLLPAAVIANLFYHKADTIEKNVRDLIKRFENEGLNSADYIKACIKQPQLFCQSPNTIENNVRDLVKRFENEGLNSIDYIKACIKLPSLFCQSPNTIEEHIKAYMYIDKNKLGYNDSGIMDKILKKNLAYSTSSIYLNGIILPQLKEQNPEMSNWKVNGIKPKLKEYFEKNPDKKFTIEILDDEMSGNFVKVIKEYCQKDFGRDDMFNIVII